MIRLLSFIVVFYLPVYALGQVETAQDSSTTVEYFIQVASLESPFESFPDLRPLGIMFKIQHKTKELYRYQLGVFSTEEQAIEIWEKVKALGYKDSFIIVRPAFRGT